MSLEVEPLPLEAWPDTHLAAATEIVDGILPLNKVVLVSAVSYGENKLLGPHFLVQSDNPADLDNVIDMSVDIMRSYEIPEGAFISGGREVENTTVRKMIEVRGEVILFERSEYEASLKKIHQA